MDFFDDDATGPDSTRSGASTTGSRSRRPERRRPDRRRTRIQRIAVLAAIIFVIVFALAWWARSCQHNRKVSTYQTYFESVSAAIDDSADLGKKFSKIVGNPTKYQRKELIATLDDLKAKQNEIAVRAGRLTPPDTLEDQQAAFATGMKVRASGFAYIRQYMLDALKNTKMGASRLANLNGFFAGPDAYYTDLVYLPAREIMQDDGVSDVNVPTAKYYLEWKALDRDRLESMLQRVGGSTKLTGTHGVALAGVTAVTTSGDVKLAKGQENEIAASADLSFTVTVENQGTVKEDDVPVTVTLTVPGGDTVPKTASIATIAAGKKQSVNVALAAPPEALTKQCKLKVVAGPVNGEQYAANNTATYRLLLQLSE